MKLSIAVITILAFALTCEGASNPLAADGVSDEEYSGWRDGCDVLGLCKKEGVDCSDEIAHFFVEVDEDGDTIDWCTVDTAEACYDELECDWLYSLERKKIQQKR